VATDLERAFEALKGKQTTYSNLWNYYHGNHPLVFSSKRLQKVFRSLDARFTENWCSAIVDSTMERIDLKRFEIAGNAQAEKRLNELWVRSELSVESDDAHQAVLVCKEAYVIVWPGDDGPEGYYNDPRLVHVEYGRENPRKALWAAKWWVESESEYRLTMYYPDRLEYYSAKTTQRGIPEAAKAFLPMEEGQADNPTNRIPVFHLRRGRNAKAGELTQGVVELQDAVNKLMSDMMVAGEYAAFKQRFIISDAEVSDLKNAPNEIWNLPAGDGIGQDTQAGEFGATQLQNYHGALDKLSLAMAVISRTPKYYFFAQSGDPSGEALLAMEAPLNKKCARYIERFTPTWREVAAFLLELDGIEVDKWDIRPVFDRPETVQPLTRSQARNFDINSGVPLRTLLRRAGWSEAELERMAADRQAETTAQSQSLAAALVQQQRNFDQGQEDEE